MIAVTPVAVYWQEFRALPWVGQVSIALAYLFLLGLSNRPTGSLEVARATALLDEDRYQDALDILEPVLCNTPNVAQAWYIKGSCMVGLGQQNEAEKCWKEAIRRDPTHWAGAAMLSSLYLQRGQPLEAAEFYLDARDRGARDPDFERNFNGVWDALVHEGQSAERREDHKLAFRCADMCTKLKTEYPISYGWRAQLRLCLGEFQLAIEDAKKCLQLDPTYEKAKQVIRDAEIGLEKFGPTLFEDQTPSSATGMRPPKPAPRSVDPNVVTIRKPASPSASVVEDRTAEEDCRSYLWKVGDLAFDRFLVRRIVSGGMGDVYLCWDQKSVGPVALKSVQFDTSRTATNRDRGSFRLEAEHWFRLPKHPNIVTLYSVEEYQFRYLILAMEYIAGVPEVGPTLHDHLRLKGRLLVDEAVRIAVGICRAMEFVHREARLVHRDLKPENIFISSSGLAKVGDFGLALTAGTTPASQSGTQEYMAPEQFEEEEPAAVGMDIYATGVIMYEMLSGTRPIPPDGEIKPGGLGWAYHHAHSQPCPLVERCLGVPSGLCDVVMRCLAKNPEHRPRSFSALREALIASVPKYAAGLGEQGPSLSAADPSFDAFDRGVSADALGYHDEALHAYKEATANEPFRSARSEAWCNTGKVLVTLHRYPEALESFERALSIDAKDKHALLGKANTLTGMGRAEEALATAERLVQLNPQSPDALACKGLVLLKSGRVDLAEAVLQDAAKAAPDHVHVLNLLGKCALARGAWRDAEKHVERAIQLKPDFAGAHANLCQVYYAKAIETNALADPDSPDDPEASAHPLNKALKCAQIAASIEPDNPQYVVNLGLAYAKLEQYDLAIEQFEQVIRMSPEDGNAHLCLAHACFAIQDFSRALESGQRAAGLGKPEGRPIAQLATEQMKYGQRIGRPARRQDGPPQAPGISRSGDLALSEEERAPAETASDLEKTLLKPREGSSPSKHSGSVRCSCDAENPPENAFCRQCGKSLMN